MATTLADVIKTLQEGSVGYVFISELRDPCRVLALTTFARSGDGVLHATRVMYAPVDQDNNPPWYDEYLAELRSACMSVSWVRMLKVCVQWGYGQSCFDASLQRLTSCFSPLRSSSSCSKAEDGNKTLSYSLKDIHDDVGSTRLRGPCVQVTISSPGRAGM
jgi:hypothetical protein